MPFDRMPTPAELPVLRILWAHGPLTPQQVHEYLPKNRYTTILTHLQNLLAKALVQRFAQNRTHLYRARVGKHTVLTALAHSIRDRMFDGSGAALALYALRDERLTQGELKALHKVIREKQHELP